VQKRNCNYFLPDLTISRIIKIIKRASERNPNTINNISKRLKKIECSVERKKNPSETIKRIKKSTRFFHRICILLATDCCPLFASPLFFFF